MSQAVDLEMFYPHPPERVWQVLTDRRALAAWMMENDFEPKLGHKFQFYSQPLPGLKTAIQCKVVELEKPTRLVYTWQESPTAKPSLVVWTLTTVTGGTQLRLKHHQYSYTPAVATFNRPGTINAKHNSGDNVTLAGSGTTRFYNHSGLLYAERFPSIPGLETPSCHSISQNTIPSRISDISTTLELPGFQTFTWDYFLNQKLPQVLEQDEQTHN